MAQFIPSISETREGIPQTKGVFRFVNFESMPSLPASGPAFKSKQHVRTYFNNKQIFRTVCEWFETWMPWQKRIVLCGTTDRCSTSQLEYLATALEPVFHRDFQTTLRGAYPMLMSRKPVHSDLQYEKTLKVADSEFESANSKCDVKESLETTSTSLNTFALNLVNEVISEAIQVMKTVQRPTSTHGPLNDDDHQELLSQKSVEKKDGKRKPSPIVEVQDEYSSAIFQLAEPTPSTAHSGMTSSTELTAQVPKSDRTNHTKQSATFSQQLGLLHIERKSVDTNSLLSQHQKSALRPMESSFSVRPSERRKAIHKSQAYSHYFYGQDETAFSDDSRIGESQLDALPPLEAKKVSTFNWCLSHRVTPSASSTAEDPVGSPYSRPHRHSRSRPFPGSAASTNDFFDRDKIKKLGPMKGVLRTGQINRPPHVQDIYSSHQKSYKPSKLWRPRPAIATARKDQLRAVFKEQVEQIWVWLKEWEDHEKGDLLVELIKMCDQELVRFFASCLMKRLHQYVQWLQDRMDINSLPDRVLLRIFSLLAPEDLIEAEGVCRSWYFLIAHEELWRTKCLHLGLRNNQRDLVQLVEFYMSEHAVDWREAYWQLSNLLPICRTETPRKRDTKRIWRKVAERLAQLRSKYQPEETETESSVDLDITVARPRPTSAHTETPLEDRTESRVALTPPTLRPRERMMTSELQIPPLGKTKEAQEVALDIRPELQRARNLLFPALNDDDEPLHYDGKIKQIKRVRRLQGHSDTICCVTFDMRRLASGSMDRSIRIWDIRSGKGIHRLTGHKGGIRCLQLDESCLVSGSWDMSVRVWDVVKFELVAELSGHTGVVSCLQFDNCHLVTGSHDTTLRVWNMSSHECERIIQHHADAITCLVLQGDRIVSGSFDRTIKVTDVSTGECLQTMKHELQDRVTTIQCLWNQVLAGTLTGRLLVWDFEQGTLLAAYQALDSPVYKLAVLSHDHRETKILLASADGSISEWVLETMTCVRVLQGHRGPVRDVQVSDARVVSCSEDKMVRVWDLSPPPLKPGDQDDAINTEIVNERDSD